MDRETKEGITQVLDVLKHSDKDIIDKISKKFIDFLTENKLEDYKVNIDYSNENWAQQLNEEAKVILALIYRDFIVSKEERQELLKKEQEISGQYQNEISEKYNVDNLFKKQGKNVTNSDETVALAEIKEKRWYQNVIEKILSFFGKKNKK